MMHFLIFATDAAAATTTQSNLAAMSIFSKGLFTTLLGLIGVFLVLTLFFFAIKLMQRPGKKDRGTKE
jgi:hypothetical protein